MNVNENIKHILPFGVAVEGDSSVRKGSSCTPTLFLELRSQGEKGKCIKMRKAVTNEPWENYYLEGQE